MQRHVEPPEFFLDRSMGRVKFPELLRAAGIRLTTLAERYGIPADEEIADTTWLEDAGKLGDIVVTKDAAIRRRPAEKDAIKQFGVRCFCIVNQGITAEQMAEWFLGNLDQIIRASLKPGPYIYAVHNGRIERLKL